MYTTTHFKFKPTHRYCVYLKPHHYHFFKMNSNGNENLYLEYLIQKYESWLVSKKNLNTLKIATQQYQPKTKDYKRFVLNKIDPELWKKIKEFKTLTGYSISCILRILLEWEMQEQGLAINPLLQRGDTPLPEYFFSEFSLPLYNYIHCQWWDKRNKEFFSIFFDFL
ncbi:MAG: hypothetical protein ACK4UJ_06180 [Leptonema sp. (in: bacteria)]